MSGEVLVDSDEPVNYGYKIDYHSLAVSVDMLVAPEECTLVSTEFKLELGRLIKRLYYNEENYITMVDYRPDSLHELLDHPFFTMDFDTPKEGSNKESVIKASNQDRMCSIQ